MYKYMKYCKSVVTSMGCVKLNVCHDSKADVLHRCWCPYCQAVHWIYLEMMSHTTLVFRLTGS